MKIFFNTSVSGRAEYEKNYRRIDTVLKGTGHDVNSAVFIATKDDVAEETEGEAERYYKKLMRWIKTADILVFEVSYPSLGVGHEISTALQLNKPVIVLYVRGKKPYVLEGISNDRLQIIEYELEELDRVIPPAIDYAADQQDTRFNFFISPKHQNYLDWISKSKKVPRAVFLRNLIEEAMEEDEEYQQ